MSGTYYYKFVDIDGTKYEITIDKKDISHREAIKLWSELKFSLHNLIGAGERSK